MAPRITTSDLGQRQSCAGACRYLFILYTAFPVMKQNGEHWPQVWWTRCGSDGGKVNILPKSDLWGSSVIYRKLWCAAAVVRANFYNNMERRALWSHPSPQQKKDWHLTENYKLRSGQDCVCKGKSPLMGVADHLQTLKFSCQCHEPT